jgi:hypothetical protein
MNLYLAHMNFSFGGTMQSHKFYQSINKNREATAGLKA